MQQFVLLAAIGTIVYLGYKALKRRFGADQSLQPVPVRVKSAYLERGQDGVFRPVERRFRERI